MFLFLALVAVGQRKKLSFGNLKTRSASMDPNELYPEKGNLYFGVSLFSYSELLEATDNFNQSKEVGDGGFGTVYYGKLIFFFSSLIPYVKESIQLKAQADD